MGEAVKTRRIRQAIVVGVLVALIVVAASSTFMALRYRSELGREKREGNWARNGLTNRVHEYGQDMAHILTTVRTVEPEGALSDSDIGLYSGRIVETSDKYGLVFDWITVNPNPHTPQRTDEGKQRQTLKPSPITSVYVHGELSPGSGIEGLVPMAYLDFYALLRSNDATAKALLDSDWLVSVSGREFSALVQR